MFWVRAPTFVDVSVVVKLAIESDTKELYSFVQGDGVSSNTDRTDCPVQGEHDNFNF